MVQLGTREPGEHLAMRCQLHPQLGDATPHRDQLRKQIRVALEADQQSLVELVDALDDRLDRGVVGRQLPFEYPRQERRRVQHAEFASTRSTLAKVVEEG